jgi:serine/threonine-protein phosphatase 6 regulatory ankyrin repeat subunit B
MHRIISPILIAALHAAAIASVMGAPASMSAKLITSVQEGDLGQTRQLLGEWKTAGKPLPMASDDRPLLFLAIEGRDETHPEIIDLLLASGADIAERGPWGMSALHWAASRGYEERTEQMLKHGAKLEAVDDYGRTPLLVAHSLAAAILLRAKANVFAADKSGNTALHHAAESGSAHLELLHDGGFGEINARNKSGWTALHFAAVAGNVDACRWLIGKGADVQAVTSAPYEYLSLKNAPGYGNELRIASGLTALKIAKQQHGANKWVTQRFKQVADLLSQAEKRR